MVFMATHDLFILHDFKQARDFLNTKEKISLYGWVDNKRDHGGLSFWDVRRDDLLIQVVFDEEEFAHRASRVSCESVVEIWGEMRQRNENNLNPTQENGDIEFKAFDFKIVSTSQTPPFQLDELEVVSEENVQKYRYLFLRKGIGRQLIKKRAQFFSFLRQFMEKQNFLEVNTPILTSSSPEGARDFLVPSRIHLGKFYALPQSPQIFKQLLMLSGFDKYYQLSPCFRDEDARADRSPCDFYQLDFEIAFSKQQQILDILQNLVVECYKNFAKNKLFTNEFPVFTFQEAMENYGTDKPDLRNKVKIVDVTDFFAKSDFNIFRNRIEEGDRVKAFILPESKNRGFFDSFLKQWHGLNIMKIAYTYFENDEWIGPIAKFMDNTMDFGKNGMFFLCESPENLKKTIHKLHNAIAIKGNFIDQENDYYCFIVDFPMFEYDKTSKKWDFCHNPFAMPKNYSEEKQMDEILAQQYDLVGNGFEVASGAIRNHDINLFKTIAKKIGYTEEYLLSAFPALVHGFTYGAPPHGGAAPGLEILMMILFGCDKIRDVIPFPMLQNGRDLMMNAPSTVSIHHLNELNISINKNI